MVQWTVDTVVWCNAVLCSVVQWSSAVEQFMQLCCAAVRGMLCYAVVQCSGAVDSGFSGYSDVVLCSAVLCNGVVHTVVKWSSEWYAMLCSSAVQCSGAMDSGCYGVV